MIGTAEKTREIILFPCKRIPTEAREARLLGLYPQTQEGLWMQRVKILGGVLESKQWKGLAQIARHYTQSQRLHLTTRQDIEIHDVPGARIPSVQRALAALQLSSVGACGDTLRNITVCPCSGVMAGTVDMLEAAWAIRRDLESLDEIYSLPRKFKLSLSCGREDCSSQPWIHDLSFVAERQYGIWGCKVIGAGSLGARPQPGIKLIDWIPVESVPACARASVHLFHQLGDRRNRSRARLRHVREQLGNGEFILRFREAFEREKQKSPTEKIYLQETIHRFTEVMRLQFANGDVRSEEAEALAAIAARKEYTLRIANQHQVWIFSRDAKPLRNLPNEYHALEDAARSQPTIVACPGKRSCKRALADTNELANRIRREFGGKEFQDLTVCISGCPNGCAHSAVAPIGLVGVQIHQEGQRKQAYNLFVNGGMGRDGKLASPLASKLSGEEVIEVIKNLHPGAYSTTTQSRTRGRDQIK